MNSYYIDIIAVALSSFAIMACSSEVVTGEVIDVSSDYVVVLGSVDRITNGNCGIVISEEKEKLVYSYKVLGSDHPLFVDRFTYNNSNFEFLDDSTFQTRINGLFGGVTYYYRAFRTAMFGKRIYYGSINSFYSPDYIYKAEAIDLALPSGIKWSSVNLGASNEFRPGAEFLWGETEPVRKELSSWQDYKYSEGERALTKYCREVEYGHNGYLDSLSVLERMDDAASQLLNNSWRIPTKTEWDELLNPSNCVWALEYDEASGTEVSCGFRITSRRNGNSIVLPFDWSGSATYMSSSLGYSNSEWYYAMCISREPFQYDDGTFAKTIEIDEIVRFAGSLVRPVCQ